MKKLSTKTFVISQCLILLLGLVFISLLYYVLNIQNPPTIALYSPGGGPVTSEPRSLLISVEEPDNDRLVFKPSILVSGKTTPNLPIVISTESSNLVINSKSDGQFSSTLELEPGVNTITISVFDVNGDSRFETRTVYYSKEKI
ncbi:hypothetical protein HYW42_04050 [Candidatus Daviesbacteria bacterium]|nr:hypothetical protein [Candidatus Daviesbacteria bacterium]